MNTNMRTSLYALAGAFIFASSTALANDAPKAVSGSRLLLELPQNANTPDGLGMAPDGTLILSVPNFNNDHLRDAG